MHRLFLSFLLLVIGLTSAQAQNAGGFDRFRIDPNTPRGGAEVIPDPTSSAQMRRVYRFMIEPGACSNQRHASSANSDCTFKSLRSSAYEPNFRRQTDVWTAWNMFLPTDFPVGRQQAGQGMYTFAYWHNSLCPHVALISDTSADSRLYLQTNRLDPSGRWNCLPDQRILVADLRELRGRWHRFELRTVFGDVNTGRVELYLNGQKRVEQRMNTIAPGPDKTYWVFGLYLCCNRATELVTPATAYFTRLSRAATRESLR